MQTNVERLIQSGQTLKARSIFDSGCFFTLEVIERKGGFATIRNEDGEVKRVKVRSDDQGEFLRPDSYSCAPMFRA